MVIPLNLVNRSFLLRFQGPEHSYMPSHWVPHATDPEEVIQRHVTFAKAGKPAHVVLIENLE